MNKNDNIQQHFDVKQHTKKVQCLYVYIVQPFLMLIPMSKTINIEEELYDTMQHEAIAHNETLKTHVEHTLWHQHRKQNLLNKVFKGLEIEKDEHSKIILKNLDERKFYDIDVLKQGSELYCKQCKSQNCKHTSFVWTQFEDLDIYLSK